MHPWRRFFSALLLAPVAGGLAAFLAALVFVFFAGKASERNLADAAHLGITLGFWALLICLAYVLVIGTAAFAYARLRGRALTLPMALSVALLAGVAPFTYIAFHKDPTFSPGGLLFSGLALLCSFATAWTFWRVAFAERATA